MKIIKLLILKEWYRSFFGSCITLFILITAANLISGFLRSSVTANEVLINYLLEIPSIFSKIFPISCLVASLFMINKLRNRNELTAIFASGFSRKSFFSTILLATLPIFSIQLALSGILEPFLKSSRDELMGASIYKFKNLKSKGLQASTVGTGKMWYKSDGYFLAFSKFDKNSNSLNSSIRISIDSENKINEIAESDQIQYVDNKWLENNAIIYSNLNLESFPEIKDSESNPSVIREHISDIIQIESDITTLNMVRLLQYILRLQKSGINVSEYMVMFLDKINTSLICVVFAIISGLSAFSPNRRGASFGKSIGFVFVFSILYWLIYSYLLELGKNSKLDVYISVFATTILFFVYISIEFYRNRKI